MAQSMAELFDQLWSKGLYDSPPTDEEIRETFLARGRAFIETIDDPTTEHIADLVLFYEDHDSPLTDEERVLLWVLGSLVQWLVDLIPPIMTEDGPVSGSMLMAVTTDERMMIHRHRMNNE